MIGCAGVAVWVTALFADCGGSAASSKATFAIGIISGGSAWRTGDTREGGDRGGVSIGTERTPGVTLKGIVGEELCIAGSALQEAGSTGLTMGEAGLAVVELRRVV